MTEYYMYYDQVWAYKLAESYNHRSCLGFRILSFSPIDTYCSLLLVSFSCLVSCMHAAPHAKEL